MKSFRPSHVVPALAVLLCVCQVAVASQPAACSAHDFAQKYPALIRQTVRVLQDAERAPYTFRDRDDAAMLSGIDADLARAVFDCIGVQVEFVTGAWGVLLPDVVAEQSDAVWNGVYYTRERANQVDYVTYMKGAIGGLVRKGNPKTIAAVKDLCGRRAVAGLGTPEFALLKEQSAACRALGQPDIELMAFTRATTGERLLENDRTDLLLTDLPLCMHLARNSNERVDLAFSARTDVPIGVGVRKGHTDLEHALQDAIHFVQADGTQRNLLVKYGLDPELQQTPEVIR